MMTQIFIVEAMMTILYFLASQQLTYLYSYTSYHVIQGSAVWTSSETLLETWAHPGPTESPFAFYQDPYIIYLQLKV